MNTCTFSSIKAKPQFMDLTGPRGHLGGEGSGTAWNHDFFFPGALRGKSYFFITGFCQHVEKKINPKTRFGAILVRSPNFFFQHSAGFFPREGRS